jgi:integrase
VWELRVHAGGGKYVSRTVTGNATAADAALRALIGEIEATRDRRSSDMTVGEWLAEWLAMASKSWASPATANTARNVIDSAIIPEIGTVELADLTRRRVQRWIGTLQERGLAAGTIKRYHGVLRTALEEAVNLELLDVNPATKVRLPKIARREHPDVDPGKLAVAYEAADRHTKLLIRLATATGARRGQLCGLQWADFDHDAGTVRIARSVAKANGGIVVKETKTGNVHVMSLDAATLAQVADYRAWREEQLHGGSADTKLTDDTFVFSRTPNGSIPWYPDTIDRKWRAVADPAGLTGIRVHDLRHFHATTLISQGVDVVTVAQRLGHKNPAVTLRVYSHPITAADQAAAETISQFLPTD